MSCSKTLQDLKIAEKAAQDAYDEAKKQDDDAKAALDLATQQEADAEKKRKAGSILFTVFGEKLVSECRIPTAAVAQLGLFRILLGGNNSIVSDVVAKIEPTSVALFGGVISKETQAAMDKAASDNVALDVFYSYDRTFDL